MQLAVNLIFVWIFLIEKCVAMFWLALSRWAIINNAWIDCVFKSVNGRINWKETGLWFGSHPTDGVGGQEPFLLVSEY